ncbi:glycosyltransferase family 2 protein [Geothrix sp. SG200]|uniref:glycosyltransferase family 2 protein n=1 Tax=Geothrix sp. SG200 TaxID=2922865 RepID=UPI001FABD3E2|nr:glycosyltransferase family 2 protein [Geothrix sp. SG200]
MNLPAPAPARVAVLIPCFNEEAAIARVVADFRAALPGAVIHVYDNNSTDRTVEVARAAGALVGFETAQGKGHVVRRMFADIDADVYVMVDGDATYDAASAPALVDLLRSRSLDMVVGCRVERDTQAYRRGHRFGNRLLTTAVRLLFGQRFTDILSGYRVFSRRFVKSFPALSRGFEIETELTVHALELAMPVAELPTPYGARPEGSASKLRTYADGFRILRLIASLYRNEQPLQFFSVLSTFLALAAIGLSVPIFVTYFRTGLVPRFPTAILTTGMMVISALGYTCGLILDTVTRGRKELKRMAYLAIPAVGGGPAREEGR